MAKKKRTRKLTPEELLFQDPATVEVYRTNRLAYYKALAAITKRGDEKREEEKYDAANDRFTNRIKTRR